MIENKNILKKNLNSFQHRQHPHCVVCGRKNILGLKLCFLVKKNGHIISEFLASDYYQGYSGIQHGGVTATLLDGVMTNCLFAAGITALTGELNIKYLSPVKTGEKSLMEAWVEKSTPPLYALAATLKQNSKIVAQAQAKFIETTIITEDRTTE